MVQPAPSPRPARLNLSSAILAVKRQSTETAKLSNHCMQSSVTQQHTTNIHCSLKHDPRHNNIRAVFHTRKRCSIASQQKLHLSFDVFISSKHNRPSAQLNKDSATTAVFAAQISHASHPCFVYFWTESTFTWAKIYIKHRIKHTPTHGSV